MQKVTRGKKTFIICQQDTCNAEQRLDSVMDSSGTTCNKCWRKLAKEHNQYDGQKHRIYTCKVCSITGRVACFSDTAAPKCRTCAITDGELPKPNERDFKHMITKREKKALVKDRPPYADPAEKNSMTECHPGRVKVFEAAITNLKNLNFGTALEVACGGG